jgi:MFS family permease
MAATAANQPTARERLSFFYLNIGHFLDHLFTLIFATVAALALVREWGLTYAQLVPYATPGFVAFGLFSLPAGRLADRWSRHGMMVVFFIGIGIASIATGFAQSPLQIGIGLFFVGILAAIYHPVGLAMVVDSVKGLGEGQSSSNAIWYLLGLGLAAFAAGYVMEGWLKWALFAGGAVPMLLGLVSPVSGTGLAIGLNGVWGNLGVGAAALITGWFIDNGGWRSAFIVPGIVSIVIGLVYWWHVKDKIRAAAAKPKVTPAAAAKATAGLSPDVKAAIFRITAIVFFTTAVSSLIFQSTTFALPKVFDERLGGIAGSATLIGWLAFIVFAVASLAQLVVGAMLDKLGPRTVFMTVAAIQLAFFAIMPGLKDWWALAVALGFMLGAFGAIPINDYMIGKMAKSELRATIYGVRYIVSFTVLALALPLIAWIHANWGFDVLFRVLAVAATVIFLSVTMLPRQIPDGGVSAVSAKA